MAFALLLRFSSFSSLRFWCEKIGATQTNQLTGCCVVVIAVVVVPSRDAYASFRHLRFSCERAYLSFDLSSAVAFCRGLVQVRSPSLDDDDYKQLQLIIYFCVDGEGMLLLRHWYRRSSKQSDFRVKCPAGVCSSLSSYGKQIICHFEHVIVTNSI